MKKDTARFFKQLEIELAGGIDEILNHPFLQRISNASLNREQLRFFAKQYGIYCSYFPRFLAGSAANIPDDQTRLPVIENLWEEHGSGKIEKSHRVLYDKFASALGIREKELKEAAPLPNTRATVENILDLCEEGHFLESLGALGPGTEFFTSREYQLILNGLSRYPFLTGDDLEFWAVHITLDDDHYGEMIESIAPWVVSETERSLVSLGARKAIEMEILFWDGLEKYLPVKK